MKTTILNTAKAVIGITIILIVFASCRKELNIDNATNNEVEVTKFKEIKTASSFDWRLTQTITFLVTPSTCPIKFERTLTISSEDGREVFLSVLLSASDSYSTTLFIPSRIKNVKITFGSLNKYVAISNKTIKFDYIQ